MKFISKLDYFNKVYHIRRILAVLYQFIHPDDATQTFSFEEQVESFVNIVEAHFVCYELVQIKLLQIKSIINCCITRFHKNTKRPAESESGSQRWKDECKWTLSRYFWARVAMSDLGFSPPKNVPQTLLPLRISMEFKEIGEPCISTPSITVLPQPWSHNCKFMNFKTKNKTIWVCVFCITSRLLLKASFITDAKPMHSKQ